MYVNICLCICGYIHIHICSEPHPTQPPRFVVTSEVKIQDHAMDIVPNRQA